MAEAPAAAATTTEGVVPAPVEQRVEAVPVAVPSATGSLRVHVRWADGTAASAMGVSLQPPDADGGFLAQRWQDTDGAGVVEWNELAPNPFTVASRHGGDAQVVVRAGAIALCEIEIPRGVDLRGVVVDSDGKSVPGATIVDGPRTSPSASDRLLEATRANGNGAFFLRSVPEDHVVAAFAEGFGPSLPCIVADLAALPEARLVLLSLGGAVDGRVIDDAGAPIESAWVALGFLGLRKGAPPLHVTQTDAAGRFHLLGAPFETARSLHASAAGCTSWHGEVRAIRGQPAFVEIRLQRESVLRGTIRAATGEVTPGARILVQQKSRPSDQADGDPVWSKPRVATGPDGVYSIENLPPGVVRVTVTHSRFGADVQQFEVGPGESLHWDPQLRVLSICGKLVDADNVPIAGWRVGVSAGKRQLRGATTRIDGTFEITGCTQVVHTLQFRPANEAWTEPAVVLRGVEPSPTPLLVRVPAERMPTCWITGMLAPDQGKALADYGAKDGVVLMVLGEGDGSRFSKALFPGDGFEFGPLPSGRYAFRFQPHDTVVRSELPLIAPCGFRDLLPGQRVDLGALHLPALGELEIELLDVDGLPVAEASVWLASVGASEGASVAVRSGRGARRLAPGIYVPARQGRDRHVEHAPIAVTSGARTRVTLRYVKHVQRTLRLDLSALDRPTRAFVTLRKEGVPVLRSWLDAREVAEPYEQPWSFTPGDWELELELPNGRTERFGFVVTADTDAPPIEIRVAK